MRPIRPTLPDATPSVTKLLIDSLREVSVLVLVFGALDGVRGSEALVLAASSFLGAILLERLKT